MKKIKKQTITSKTRILIPVLLLSLTLLFCLTTVSAASGNTIYVNGSSGNDSWDGQSAVYNSTTGSGPKLSIKNATGTVNTNGTIHIANGQYTGENNTQITIDKNMNIIGESQLGTIINGTGTNWIFHVNNGINVTITNLTLTNSYTTGDGGAIYNYDGTCTVTNCNFKYNTADNGGAIYNYDGTCTVNNCDFTDNTANNEGGAIYNGLDCTVNNCDFTDNTAYDGGAIYNDCSCTVNNCDFTDNTAHEGGAILNHATIDVISCAFRSNSATDGGAIYNDNIGHCAVTNCDFAGNTANDKGGAIYNRNSCTVNKCDLTGNAATSGSNMYSTVTLQVSTNWWGSSAGPGTSVVNVNDPSYSQTSINHVPVAADDSASTYEGKSINVDVLTNDRDMDTCIGDLFSVTSVTQGNHGSVTINQGGTVTYTPNTGFVGTDTFRYTITDTNGGTSIATVTVNVLNHNPIAKNDTTNTKEGKSVNISVLGNDSDADGDSLTVTNITKPNHGTAAINTDGTITYTPNTGWYGLDSFTYTISDGNGGTATATVNITVNQTVSNLYINTTTSNSNPIVGETFLLTYKLGNYGPDTSENVTVTFQLPEGLNFVNIKIDSGKCTYDETTRTVTWTLDTVPVGDPYLYLTVQAAGDGTYKITPNVTSDTYNLNSGDNGNITVDVQSNSNNSSNGNSNSGNIVNAASKITKTVGLQDTGLPLNYLLLAVLMVLGGLIPKRK